MTKPEPVGWWCEDNLSIHSKYETITKRCEKEDEPVYTRTQVRKGFEELAEWCKTDFVVSGKGTHWEFDADAIAKEVRRRMEEW